jgi:hypothetical protein
MGRKLDLKGVTFGRLVVTGEDTVRSRDGKVKWFCRCNCGALKSILGRALLSGNTKSCGCLWREIKSSHILCKHPIYSVYSNMKMRCYNTKAAGYKNYGGRGITVCDRWLESTQNFIEDMESGYSEGLQLDRVDNNKGYCKENCRWVTKTQNSYNRGADKGSSSKYKGVTCRARGNKWEANVVKDGKLYYLGTFVCEREAALAYNKKAVLLFGEFAYMNVIKGMKHDVK